MNQVTQSDNKPEAVVISGGGAKFFFQLGILDRLIQIEKIDPFAFLGVSAGALLSAYLGQSAGPGQENHDDLLTTLKDLKSVAFNIKSSRDIFRPRVPGLPGVLDELIALSTNSSIYKTDPLRNLIEQEISLERIRDSKREVRIGAVSLEDGQYHSIEPNNPFFREFVLASSSIPIIFPPVVIDNISYVDGGVINVTPLASLFDLCREKKIEEVRVHVVLSSQFGVKQENNKHWSSFKIASRTADLLVSEIFRNDIEVARLRNLENGSVKATFKIYQPGDEGPGIDSLDFNERDTRVAFWRGRRTLAIHPG